MTRPGDFSFLVTGSKTDQSDRITIVIFSGKMPGSRKNQKELLLNIVMIVINLSI